MANKVNIHATHRSQSAIIICTRAEFLSKITERFGIPEEDIRIYDAKSDMKIRPEHLDAIMNVNIKRKRHSKRNKCSEASPPPQDIDEIIQKLTENNTLDPTERYFLVKLVTERNSHTVFTDEKVNPLIPDGQSGIAPAPPSIKKKVKNVKLQVHPEKLIPTCSVESQTDLEHDSEREREDDGRERAGSNSNKKRPIETNDAMFESKRLAITQRKIDPDSARKLMDELYEERRSFILTQLPLVSFVKEKYPLLFSVNEVRNEIDRIFHQGQCELFLQNIGKYAKPIINMVKEGNPIFKLMKEKIRCYETDMQKKYALEVGSLLLLPHVMKEELFRCIKLIDGEPLDKESENLPYIETQAKLSELFFDDHLFRIYVENTLLCEVSDFKEALLCLCGSYYIFNIEYPRANWNTFSALERLYLEKSDSDTENLNAFALQVIKSLYFKAQASEAKRKRIKY